MKKLLIKMVYYIGYIYIPIEEFFKAIKRGYKNSHFKSNLKNRLRRYKNVKNFLE